MFVRERPFLITCVQRLLNVLVGWFSTTASIDQWTTRSQCWPRAKQNRHHNRHKPPASLAAAAGRCRRPLMLLLPLSPPPPPRRRCKTAPPFDATSASSARSAASDAAAAARRARSRESAARSGALPQIGSLLCFVLFRFARQRRCVTDREGMLFS